MSLEPESTLPDTMAIQITQRWDGEALEEHDYTSISLKRLHDSPYLRVEIDAPFHDDPPPPHAPGSTPELWEHEVVELFLLGEEEHYLELEFGPHGHYLLLKLHGVRQVVRQGMPCEYEARIEGDRWHGEALIPMELLPPGAHAVNAHAIHGEGGDRRYMSHSPNLMEKPDFHTLERFVPFP